MPAIAPVAHPAAWKAGDLPPREQLAIDLEPRHLAALDAALRHAERRGASVQTLDAESFPLDVIAEDLEAWKRRLKDGIGLLLLRGFPIEAYSVEEWERLFLGLGHHLGVPVSQSNLGDRIGHVLDVGGDDRRERAYRNRRKLDLHTDRCDYIGMLCLRRAKSGGVSGYASALAVHNEILATRPELLAPLYAGYRLHRFGEQDPDEPPVTRDPVPIFSFAGAHPNVVYIRGYIQLAVDEGHYALSELEREALDYFDAIASREDFCLELLLEPGEATFTNNCLLLHRRSAFEDHPEPERRRYLLRIWLHDPAWPTVPAVRAHKSLRGIEKRQGAGTYYRGRGFAAGGEARY